jgi:hypothetical protein
MIKKWIYYTSVLALIVFTSLSFKPSVSNTYQGFLVGEDEQLLYEFPSLNIIDYQHLNIPYTGKFFVGYKEALAFKESQGKYSSVNTLGYMGKYQFGSQTLKSIGIHDSTAFLNSPKLQEKAFVALLSKNKYILREEIDRYSGKVIAGVLVTESGILAAAHLGGAGSVKKFFKSRGKRDIKDQYGSSIRSFMKKFGGYETYGIIADNNARVH